MNDEATSKGTASTTEGEDATRNSDASPSESRTRGRRELLKGAGLAAAGAAGLLGTQFVGTAHAASEAFTDVANTFTTGPQTVETGGNLGVVVKAGSTQLANLVEVQDSGGSVVMAVGPKGQLVSPSLPVFNVKDYGALGDGGGPGGTTDDGPAFRAAFDALATLLAAGPASPPGGTVFVPPGVYRIHLDPSTGIEWPHKDNVALVGAGRNASTIMFERSVANDYPGLLIDGVGGLSGVTLSGLTFMGGDPDAGVDALTSYEPVKFYRKVSDVRVENCRFTLGRHAGLRFTGDFVDTPNNPWQSDIQDVTVTGCEFAHIGTNSSAQPTGAGLLAAGVKRLRVSDCTFSDCGWMAPPPNNQPLFHAVYIGYGSWDIVVEGCYFDGSENLNTRLSNGGGVTGANVIANNVFEGQDINFLWGEPGSVFSNNLLIDTSLSVGGRGVVVTGNVFRRRSKEPAGNEPEFSGMLSGEVGPGTQDLVVSGNTFINDAAAPNYEVEFYAIWLELQDFQGSINTDWLVTGNKFIGMRVLKDVYKGSRMVFSNNHVKAPTHDSSYPLISLLQDSESVFLENTFVTGDSGVALRDQEVTALLQGNLFRSSGPGEASIMLGAVAVHPGTDPYRMIAGESFTTPVVTSSIPAAGPEMDGRLIVEKVGTRNKRNVIVYAGGQRFRLDGGTAF